jgi:prolyl-tRNA editing enzyme YbaK/EbsC (Cys-tRNA(Pro) deacylase)
MTLSKLQKSATCVQDAFIEKGLDFKVIELDASTRTAQDAAIAIGCEVAQIVKSLIFCTMESNQPLLVLTSGINRVNEKTIANYVGEKIKKAEAEFTRAVTGYAIGGIPPLGHKSEIKTLIDEDLLQYNEIWAAAGTPHAVFCLNSSSLQEVTNGVILNIK